jgi:phosphonate degradation associated HDIG domain protein
VALCDDIFATFDRRGSDAYFGEAVSMREHALQAAHFARLARAPDELVVAALLHDIGHLVEDVPDDLADWTSDARHEDTGATWLARHFGAAVCDPVRLHVAAKRYLCATQPTYHAKLSPASVHTLNLQGGPMSPAEVAAFEREPHFRDAVHLRWWDDAGKVAGLATAPLEHYRGLIEAAAGRHRECGSRR